MSEKQYTAKELLPPDLYRCLLREAAVSRYLRIVVHKRYAFWSKRLKRILPDWIDYSIDYINMLKQRCVYWSHQNYLRFSDTHTIARYVERENVLNIRYTAAEWKEIYKNWIECGDM